MNHPWQKLGLLYCPAGPDRHPKLLSHAANPLAMLLEGDVYRVFFSGRDAANRSSVGAVDVDIVRRAVVREHAQPFFEHGPADSFYADGVSIGNCYSADGQRYILFMGWQTAAGAHWRGDVGRLRLDAGLASLTLDGQQAFLGVDATDPLSLSYPWVLQEDGHYRMWYGSTLSWDAGNGEMLHVLQQASSTDGHHWHREGLAVPHALGLAQAFSRPSVLRDAEGYHMWFSYRSGQAGQTYRIGYAASPDGRNWNLRLEASGIDVSAGGWDAEMIEYPFVFEHKGERYMLYNGNGHGKSGFGLAIMAHD